MKRYLKQHPALFKFLKYVVILLRYIKAISYKSQYNSFEKVHSKTVANIQKKGYHCWFGYYDKSPVSPDGKKVLFNRVKQGASFLHFVEICVYDISSGNIHVIATSSTWNWQQGCMAQWIDNKRVSYNSLNKTSTGFQTNIVSLSGQIENTFCRAAYAYNVNHNKFLSLNFYRLDLYAKGYGYPYAIEDLDDRIDGIYEYDIDKNNVKFLISLKDVIAFEPHFRNSSQHYINHVTYCPDERYVMFIHRWQIPGGAFSSRLLILDTINGSLHSLLDNKHVSHYCWKNSTKLLIYATDRNNRKGYHLIDIFTKETMIISGLPSEDGHPSYSSNGRYILTDTYPDDKRYQYLLLFDTVKDSLRIIDRLHSPFKFFDDCRCDLHPRWCGDSNVVSVDTTYSGYRSLKIYKIN